MVGRFGWVVDGFSLGPLSGGTGAGKSQGQGTYSRVVFAGRRALTNSPVFYVICYTLSSGGFAAPGVKTIANGVVEPRCPGQYARVEVLTT